MATGKAKQVAVNSNLRTSSWNDEGLVDRLPLASRVVVDQVTNSGG